MLLAVIAHDCYCAQPASAGLLTTEATAISHWAGAAPPCFARLADQLADWKCVSDAVQASAAWSVGSIMLPDPPVPFVASAPF